MAVEIDCKIEGMKEIVTAINKLGAIGKKELKLEIKRTAKGIENHYRRGVKKHFDTGVLDKSISSDSRDGWKTAEVGSNAEYSPYIEFGTRSHTITPRVKKWLRFFWGKVDDYVFAKKVNHPGTRANPALFNAFIEWASGNKFATRLRKRLDTYKL